jgi:Family of unknown function (DUF5670)
MIREVKRCGSLSNKPSKKGNPMLWTIAVVLLLLWGLGMVSSYTLGGFIHILLVLAVVTVLIRLITGRRITS